MVYDCWPGPLQSRIHSLEPQLNDLKAIFLFASSLALFLTSLLFLISYLLTWPPVFKHFSSLQLLDLDMEKPWVTFKLACPLHIWENLDENNKIEKNIGFKKWKWANFFTNLKFKLVFGLHLLRFVFQFYTSIRIFYFILWILYHEIN